MEISRIGFVLRIRNKNAGTSSHREEVDVIGVRDLRVSLVREHRMTIVRIGVIGSDVVPSPNVCAVADYPCSTIANLCSVVTSVIGNQVIRYNNVTKRGRTKRAI